MSKIYSIIPARGGSKGLPEKNIRPLAGYPVIYHTIKAALECNLVCRSFVTTEDKKIKELSLSYGVEVIDRPAELSADNSMITDVVRHAIETIKSEIDGIYPEYFVLLQPTSPLRNSVHLTECIEKFLSSNALSAISVTPVNHHPFKDYLIEDQKLEPFFGKENLYTPRQKLREVYEPNGAIYLVKTEEFIKDNHFYLVPCMPYIMPKELSIDIDSTYDIQLCEYLLTKRRL